MTKEIKGTIHKPAAHKPAAKPEADEPNGNVPEMPSAGGAYVRHGGTLKRVEGPDPDAEPPKMPHAPTDEQADKAKR